MSGVPPLLPKLDAILVLDGEGNRLAGKYYGNFLKAKGDKTAEQLRDTFEKQLQQKIAGIAARADAAEVVTCQGRTCVFCGGAVPGGVGSDVRVVHIGPASESELVLAYLCEGMYDALSRLMGGATDRTMVLDNLELVFLLIDEHCDGGIILEVDGAKLASAVLLQEEGGAAHDDGVSQQPGMGGPHMAHQGPMATQDMTVGQAFRQFQMGFMSSLNSRDGM